MARTADRRAGLRRASLTIPHLLWAAIVAVALCVAPASAQQLVSDPAAVTLEAKKAALFQQMLADPSNLDVTFAYANVAAQLGDNEAAVSALERMLLFNPSLPRVDLELGALYFRMGSFEIAQTYFQKALAGNPPPEVQARVNEYLAQITTQESPSRFSGYVMTGIQYQSDANVAPGSALINSPLGPVLLSSQFVKQRDFNAFATGSLLYSYDLGTQNGDAIEAVGTAFVDHYFKVSRLDLDFAELTVGPRFRFPNVPVPGVQSASLKPYVILNEVGLGENQYFDTYGAGLEATATLGHDLALRSYAEFRQKTFDNAPDRPLSIGLNGQDILFTINLTKPMPFIPNSALSFQFDFLDQQTKFAFYTNKSYAGTLAYRIRYDDPTHLLKHPWETTAFVTRTWDDYASPDPCCVTGGTPFAPSFSSRNDHRWRFGIAQVFQITDRIGLVVQAQRDIVSSNLPLYGYTSNSVIVGPQFRF
jgi:hypothetical protein